MDKNQLLYDEKDKPILIAAYQAKLKEVELQLNECIMERDRVQSILRQLASDRINRGTTRAFTASKAEAPSKTFSIPDMDALKDRIKGYDKEWKWEDKITFVLKERNVISRKTEIFDRMSFHEPELIETEDTKTASSKSVGATLSRLAKPGKTYAKYEQEGSRAYYGLADWFEKDGFVKSEYAAKNDESSDYDSGSLIDLF